MQAKPDHLVSFELVQHGGGHHPGAALAQRMPEDNRTSVDFYAPLRDNEFAHSHQRHRWDCPVHLEMVDLVKLEYAALQQSPGGRNFQSFTRGFDLLHVCLFQLSPCSIGNTHQRQAPKSGDRFSKNAFAPSLCSPVLK